jgi:hypothetical protein
MTRNKNGLPRLSCAKPAPRHGSHVDSDLQFLKNYPFEGLNSGISLISLIFMELLLNLAWLLLAIPAWFLWRGHRSARQFGSVHCLLALGCMLVVLFPVVSATDDLHAMRAEMEESPDGKRSIRQTTNDKPPVWKWQSAPALPATTSSLIVSIARWQPLPTASLSTPAAPAIERPSRAPPRSFPG